jgi:hypothetical protein
MENDRWLWNASLDIFPMMMMIWVGSEREFEFNRSALMMARPRSEFTHSITHTHTKKKKKEPRVCVEHPPFFFFGGHTHRQTEKMYNNMHTAHTHTHKKPTNRQSFQHAEVNSLSLSTSSDSLCVLFIPTDDWCIHLFTFSTSINVTLFGKWSPLKLWMCLILTPFDTTSMLVRKENRK